MASSAPTFTNTHTHNTTFYLSLSLSLSLSLDQSIDRKFRDSLEGRFVFCLDLILSCMSSLTIWHGNSTHCVFCTVTEGRTSIRIATASSRRVCRRSAQRSGTRSRCVTSCSTRVSCRSATSTSTCCRACTSETSASTPAPSCWLTTVLTFRSETPILLRQNQLNCGAISRT